MGEFNKKLMAIFANIFIVIIFLAMIAGLYYIVKFLILIWELFFALPVELSVSIFATVVTVIGSVISILLVKYLEKKRDTEIELRDRKIPIYQKFMEFNSKLFLGDKSGKEEMTDNEMVDYFNEFTHSLMIWGPDEVIKAWNEYREKAIEHNINSQKGGKYEQDEEAKGKGTIETMHSYERLLFALRKDVGHKNKSISQGDLLRMFINDYDEYKEKY